MKSLSAYSICQALENHEVERVLIGIETYNATALDRESNRCAKPGQKDGVFPRPAAATRM